MKDLNDKAISIKGKQYVLVSDRVLYFNETYPNGSIRTERSTEENREVIKAFVFPDTSNMDRMFTGYSQAVWGDGYINKTSALENAETSAVGRALAMMGIGVMESIASADEINKAEGSNGFSPRPAKPFLQNFHGGKSVPKGGTNEEFNPELKTINYNEM